MKNKPLISVIMPVYNAKCYLSEAVDSILGQTFSDWELLLVDDGSEDGSGLICDQYSEKDPRIHVFHQENQGVSAARNQGLSLAKGEWICFIDSDDWMEENALELLYSHSDGMDVVMGLSPLISNKKRIVQNDEPARYVLRDLSADKKTELNEQGFFLTVWDKLYRKTGLNQYFPLDMEYGEDTSFNLLNFKNWGNIILLPVSGYHYRTGRNSLSTKVKFNSILYFRKSMDHYSNVFADCPEIMRAKTRAFFRSLRKYFFVIANKSNKSREEKVLVIHFWMGEPCMDLSRIDSSGLEGKNRKMYDYIVDKNAEKIYQMMMDEKEETLFVD